MFVTLTNKANLQCHKFRYIKGIMKQVDLDKRTLMNLKIVATDLSTYERYVQHHIKKRSKHADDVTCRKLDEAGSVHIATNNAMSNEFFILRCAYHRASRKIVEGSVNCPAKNDSKYNDTTGLSKCHAQCVVYSPDPSSGFGIILTRRQLCYL